MKTLPKKRYKLTRNTEGAGVVVLLSIIVALALVSAVAFYVYQQQSSSGTAEEQSSSTAQPDETCRTQDDVEVCSWVEDMSPRYADGYRLTAEYHNTSQRTFEYTYSSGCTSPTRLVNGSTITKDSIRNCTMAMTPVSIDPGSKREFSSVFTPDMLSDGKNTIQLNWAGIKTLEIEVGQLEQTEEDKELLRERCMRSQKIATGCEMLTLYVADDSSFETYAEIDDYLDERYGLGVFYRSTYMSPEDEPLFSVSVSVPAFEEERFVELLQSDQRFNGTVNLSF